MDGRSKGESLVQTQPKLLKLCWKWEEESVKKLDTQDRFASCYAAILLNGRKSAPTKYFHYRPVWDTSQSKLTTAHEKIGALLCQVFGRLLGNSGLDFWGSCGILSPFRRIGSTYDNSKEIMGLGVRQPLLFARILIPHIESHTSMKASKISFLCALLFITLSLIQPLTGYTKTKKAPPTKAQSSPKAAQQPTDPNVLTVEAKGAVLADVATGTRMVEYNPEVPIEPASFTKVLTLYLVFEALQRGQIQLQDEVYISETAWRTGGSKMFVGIGSKVPLEDLIKGIAVLSGNDACVAVAEHIDGSVGAFVADMNRKAQELGMVHSIFLNPHGLPAEGQITTAGDMATLAIAYLRQFPQALKYHSMQEYTYNGITQYNRNHLLRKDSTVDGLKTGFVEASGYHLTATAIRDGMRLVAVVMGTPRPSVREREAAKMLAYGYRRYATVNPFTLDQPVATVKVWRGVKDQVDLFAAEPCNVLVLQSAKNSVKWTVEAPSELSAPIASGQPVGKINFTVGDSVARSIALTSHENVAEAGWFKKMWQPILRVGSWNWKYIGAVIGVICLIPIAVMLVARVQSRSRSHKGRRVKRF